MSDEPTSHVVAYEPSGGVGGATITIDGADVTGLVTRFSLDHRAGEPAGVFLELRPGADLADVGVTGVVTVREVVHEDEHRALSRLLDAVDPGEFEKACLAAMELGGPATFGQAAVAVLREWADGGQ